MDMIVAYDIANPRRINKIARIMKDYGKRVQKSIFEVSVSEREFARMKERTEKQMELSEDGVKYFPLCEKCAGVPIVLGMQSNGWDDSTWLEV